MQAKTARTHRRIFPQFIILNTLVFMVVVMLAACQSQAPKQASQKVHNTTLQPKRGNQLPLMQVRKSMDGVQDVEWQIISVQNKRMMFFNQYPSLLLNSAAKTLSGHTGCNVIYGRYQYEFAQQKIVFDAMAGHESCQKALAQEADLMDAIQRIKRFQLDGTHLYLLDEKGQRLIQAQRKRQ